ncbi:unnamed protein product, partial [Pleuronectes platessa]
AVKALGIPDSHRSRESSNPFLDRATSHHPNQHALKAKPNESGNGTHFMKACVKMALFQDIHSKRTTLPSGTPPLRLPSSFSSDIRESDDGKRDS